MKLIRGILGLLWKCWVGLVFVLFAILFYPFFAILLSRETWKKKSFYLFVVWSWVMRIFCLYGIRIIERAKLPKGPYVIIANHASYLDIFLMHSLLPDHPFLFMGKGEILGYPILKTYFNGLNIPVHRQDRGKAAKSFIQAKKAVVDGWSIVIYPEGGIPDKNRPKMMAFKTGAFRLAKELSIPIVPVTFTNNHELFTDPLDLLGVARPGISRVYIHPAVLPEEMNDLTDKEIRDLCFDRINQPLLKEHPWIAEN